jgi:hypothetical protein
MSATVMESQECNTFCCQGFGERIDKRRLVEHGVVAHAVQPNRGFA